MMWLTWTWTSDPTSCCKSTIFAKPFRRRVFYFCSQSKSQMFTSQARTWSSYSVCPVVVVASRKDDRIEMNPLKQTEFNEKWSESGSSRISQGKSCWTWWEKENGENAERQSRVNWAGDSSSRCGWKLSSRDWPAAFVTGGRGLGQRTNNSTPAPAVQATSTVRA